MRSVTTIENDLVKRFKFKPWKRKLGLFAISGWLLNGQQPCGFPLVTHCLHCFPPLRITPFLTHNPRWHNGAAYRRVTPQRTTGRPGWSWGLCSAAQAPHLSGRSESLDK